MAKYLIARNDKLTGRKGLMGVLRIDNEVKPRRNAHEVATLFPRRIASRAARFSIVEALDLDALVEQYGPEI